MEEFCDNCSWEDTNKERKHAILRVTITDLEGTVLERMDLCKACYKKHIPVLEF